MGKEVSADEGKFKYRGITMAKTVKNLQNCLTLDTSVPSGAKLIWIPKTMIFVDHSYQREKISIDTVRSIKVNWNWLSFGAMVIADREGVYYVVDGQHRLLAARSIQDISVLPCVVYKSSSIIDEAKSFLGANSFRNPVKAVDKYKAMIVAENELALTADRMLSDLGITIMARPESYGQTGIITGILRRTQTDPIICEKALRLALKITEEENTPITTIVFEGLCSLAKSLDGEGLDCNRFQSRITEIGSKTLCRAAKNMALSLENGGPRSWGLGILGAVNKGLKTRYTVKDIS